MSFANKLNGLMQESGLSQTRLSELTGIGKSSISQYLSGKNEPSRERKKAIARTLGVQEGYFDLFQPAAEIQTDESTNMPIALAAKLIKQVKQTWMTESTY